MPTAIQTPTITLVHAVSGILAEVTDLPVQGGPIYVRNLRLIERACEALGEKYPQFRVVGQSVESETSVILHVERL